MLLNMQPKDLDLATDAPPETVMRLFRRAIPTGIQHGTVTIVVDGEALEVTTFRVEGAYSDGRRPDSVSFSPSLTEDLKRRDFTINAMALDLERGELIDPHGGRTDAKRRIIRAIGDPLQRFTEDGLRPLRACRFASQLSFTVEPDTVEGMRRSAGRLRSIARERVKDELSKMLASPLASTGLVLMADTGILAVVLPELDRCRGVEQKGRHNFDVFTHSVLACDGAPPENLRVRLAALLHDIGKPVTMRVLANGERTFHQHEAVAATMADEILRRLRFPTNVVKTVSHLVRHHMFNYTASWSDAAVRRFIARVGIEAMDDLFLLRRADQYAMRGQALPSRNLDEFRRRIDAVLEAEEALTIRDLAVNGHDLASAAGVPKGPAMGTVLAFLLDAVLDDPALNTREKLLELARNFYETRLFPTDR
jgi:poly(A) polymerase/tRNA nucleotidyltransferase (CCA-adding enzyme)